MPLTTINLATRIDLPNNLTFISLSMMAEPVVLSVVVPCFNPPAKWQQNALDNYAFICSYQPATELIIVNDGSTRNFDLVEVKKFFAAQPQVNIISYQQNKGKGFALRTGVNAAKGRFVVYTDIDFPYTQQSMQAAYNALNDGNNVVAGKRNSEYYNHLPPSRVRISKFLKFLIRSFLRIPIDDTQCGLKGFDQKGKQIFLQTTIDRFLFDLEFIFLSARQKLTIKPVDVELRSGFELSSMPWKILLQEGGNFLKIFLKGIF